MNWQRIFILGFILALFPVIVVWQDIQVERDHDALYRLLIRARSQAMNGTKPIIVYISNHFARIETVDGQFIERLFLLTLHRVRYATTLGNERIVFGVDGRTDRFNVHLHGGDIEFKSVLGHDKSLWIHCTGGITEGSNDDWTANSQKSL